MLNEAAHAFVEDNGGSVDDAKAALRDALKATRRVVEHARPLIAAAWGTPTTPEATAAQAAWTDQHMDLTKAWLDRALAEE